MSSVKQTNGATVDGRYQEIAVAWYLAIAGTSYVALSAQHIRERLAELVTAVADQLLSDDFDSHAVEQVGEALVRLNFTQPEALGGTQRTLSALLPDLIPPHRKSELASRLPQILGHLAFGFHRASQSLILNQQEHIRTAYNKVVQNLQARLLREQARVEAANEQLLGEIAQRKRAEVTLRRNQQRYRTLFENSPVAIWETDFSATFQYLQQLQAAGIRDLGSYFEQNPGEIDHCFRLIQIKDVNSTTVEMYGATDKQELLGVMETMLANRDDVALQLLAIADGHESFEKESTNTTLTGKQMDIYLRWVVMPGYHQTFQRVIVSVIDITAVKNAERALQRYSTRLRALRELDLAVLAAHSAREIANSALEHLHSVLNFDNGSVFIVDREARSVRFILSTLPYIDESKPLSIQNHLIFKTLSEAGVVYIPDLAEQADLSDHLAKVLAIGQRSLLMIALPGQEQLLGGMAISAAQAYAFGDEQLEILQEMAIPVALGLNNANLLRTERTARKQAETLREVAIRLNASLDQRELLDSVLELLLQVLPYESAAIVLQDEKIGPQLAAFKGLQDGLIEALSGKLVQLHNFKEVLRTKRPLIIPDTRTDPNWDNLPKGEYVRSWLGVPLLLQGKRLGLLAIDHSKPNAFSAQDAELVLVFANQVAMAIENARLYDRTQRYAEDLERRVGERTRELDALYEITAVASRFLPLEDILDQSLQKTLAAVQAGAGCIHILNSNREWQMSSCTSLPEEWAMQLPSYAPLKSIIESAVEQKRPVLDESEHAVRKNERFLSNLGQYAAVPLRAKSEVVGILSVFARQNALFNPEDVALLGSVADHIGVAVDNVNLHSKAQQLAIMEERERLARELHDSVTQSLYSLTLFAEASRELLERSDVPRVLEYLAEIGNTASQAFREMRLLLYELRPPLLAQEGLINAVRRRLSTVEGRTGVHAFINDDELPELPREIEEGLFRIAQEALNNTLKHSLASSVAVHINQVGPHIEMTITDNGRGFVVDKANGGIGLSTMRERCDALDGEMNIVSRPGSGTIINVRIPVPVPPDK